MDLESDPAPVSVLVGWVVCLALLEGAPEVSIVFAVAALVFSLLTLVVATYEALR